MSPQVKPKDPNKWMGVYKSLEDVPDRRRFYQFEDSFEGKDVWKQYAENELSETVHSERVKKEYDVVERDWKEYMEERNRHHALATPTHLEGWVGGMLGKWKIETVYKKWRGINSFYHWLMWHADYPHLYNPCLMATTLDGPSEKIWEQKITERMDRQSRRENND